MSGPVVDCPTCQYDPNGLRGIDGHVGQQLSGDLAERRNTQHTLSLLSVVLMIWAQVMSYMAYRNILLLYIPAFYAYRATVVNAEHRTEHESDVEWRGHVRDYLSLSAVSAAVISLSATLLQTSLGSASNTAFAWGTCSVFCACFAFALCFTYLSIMRFIMHAGDMSYLLHNIRMDGRSWMDPHLILAAPAAWLSWALVSLLIFGACGIWPNPNSSMDGRMPGTSTLSFLASILLGLLLVSGILHVAVCAWRFFVLGRVCP
ncbi:hypothetical protein OBBRIDRAFT_803425 [Obba rivulosa]|uniref:Uncharacterized protein n=1 Tax=Obba rivulosa TaxID=1052685 RepID=A0A8E2DNS5_9APHY|nr:hypothetical protein OBBRIDRAFT_803425 [Obba rivulosa]